MILYNRKQPEIKEASSGVRSLLHKTGKRGSRGNYRLKVISPVLNSADHHLRYLLRAFIATGSSGWKALCDEMTLCCDKKIYPAKF